MWGGGPTLHVLHRSPSSPLHGPAIPFPPKPWCIEGITWKHRNEFETLLKGLYRIYYTLSHHIKLSHNTNILCMALGLQGTSRLRHGRFALTNARLADGVTINWYYYILTAIIY